MIVVSRLDVWDYGVCIVVLCLTSILGVYHTIKARKAKNARAFLVSDSEIGYVPIIMSLIATYVSAIGILGFPADTYNYGIIFAFMSFASNIIIPFGLFIFLPVYSHIRGGSVFEFLELRFNRSVRLFCSAALNIKTMFYSSVAIYAPSLAINQATGLNIWLSVAVITTTCIFYTSLGGIKAVIWADATQLVVILLILILVVIKGVLDAGGIGNIWEINLQGARLDVHKSDLPYTWWTIMIAYPLHQLGSTFANQSMVQRYISKKTFKQNASLFLFGTVGVSFIQFFAMSLGFIIFSKYYGCDPLINKQITSRDQMLVLYSIETLKFCKGLPGLFIAGILCATLSTLSSTLNSLAAVTIEDYILPFKPNISQMAQIKLSKIIAILYGLGSVVFIVAVQNTSGIVQAVFNITGMIHGPIVGVLLIGMVIPWISTAAITCGLVAGLIMTGWASIGSMIYKSKLAHLPYSSHTCGLNTSFNQHQSLFNQTFDEITQSAIAQDPINDNLSLYSVPALWYTAWSIIIVFVVSQIYVILFGPNKRIKEMDPKIIAKFSRVLIGKLPLSIKIKLGFDNSVDHQLWFGAEPKELYSVTRNGKMNEQYIPVLQVENDKQSSTYTKFELK